MPAGEIVVLLGPSGCGKTTTLRCVAGLEHPTAGTISIAGRVVSSPAHGILLPPRLRDIGMVFQSYAVWPHMTVRQNVVYPLKHRRIARADAARKVDEVLALVGLSEYAERPVVALSGGQMQRVALARSIVYRPQLLLLDEPLSNLDAKLRLRLRDDLRRILKATGMTALYVTHDQAEAVVLGDRIGVMRDGKLLQMGTPDEIYNRPADLFVANFTGATNELTGTLIERNGAFGVVDIGGGSRVEAALLHGVGTGDKSPHRAAAGKHRASAANGAATLSRARPRPPLSGHADGLRHRPVRPPAGSARTRHRGAPRYRYRRPGLAAARSAVGLSRSGRLAGSLRLARCTGWWAISRAIKARRLLTRLAKIRWTPDNLANATRSLPEKPQARRNWEENNALFEIRVGRRLCVRLRRRKRGQQRRACENSHGVGRAGRKLGLDHLEKKDLAMHMGKSYTLESVRYQGTPQMITAIANNELEVSNLAYSSLAIAIENAGLDDIRVIADEFQDGVPGYFSEQFYVRKDSGINKVEDLKGKVIGPMAAAAPSTLPCAPC